jgi:hypothetical protein
MRRFDGNDLFDKLAEAGRLDEDVLEATAVAIARFHEAAVRRPDLGGAERVAAVIDGIEGSYPDVPPAPVSGDDVADVLRRIRELAEQWSGLIDARRDGGFVRDVHGDLHLRNIVLWRGAPTLFDALEFDERLRCSDCAYDIAFLLMDLMHRDMGAAANFTLNVYFRETDDLEALALLPLFIGMRAAIRGHVAISTARHSKRPPAELAEAQAYVELARRTTAPAQPAVVAVGGLSGTGKSTVARGLAPGFAPGPGALVLRSDEIRKQLAGVRPADRLGKSFYTAAWSDKIYATMVERCRRALAAGWPVVADAVYGDPAHRVALAQVAAAAGAPFTGLWLEAPRAIALERVGKRRNDASDADVDVAAAQSAARPSETGWRVVDAGGTVSETIARARAAVGGPLDGTDRAGPGKAAPAGP